MFYLVTVIIVGYLLFEKAADYWFQSLKAKSLDLAPSSGHKVKFSLPLKSSPHLVCCALLLSL